MTLFEYDNTIEEYPFCGIDEAGRGPLAGDVYAAAVILPRDITIEGLNDSKKLSEKKREQLFDIICEKAVSYCIATASVEEIDRLNILNATFLAMKRAAEGLAKPPLLALVDGNRLPPQMPCKCKTIVKGDGTSAAIAAASILAKVARDRYMGDMAKQYPQYLFEKHKGYGTALHYQMLDENGISPMHRQSFLKKYKEQKKTPQRQKGDIGEQAVADELLYNGYEILKRNHYSIYGEIDIIAKKGDTVVFVEVKTRKDGSMVSGAEAVSAAKQKKLIKTAAEFVEKEKISGTIRFDVAEVSLEDNRAEINYIENAFDGSSTDAYF